MEQFEKKEVASPRRSTRSGIPLEKSDSSDNCDSELQKGKTERLSKFAHSKLSGGRCWIIAAALFVFVLTTCLVFVSLHRHAFGKYSHILVNSEIQLQRNEKGLIEWKTVYNDMLSPQAQHFIKNIEDLLQKSMLSEGIAVTDVVVTKLFKANPVSISKNEQALRNSGAISDQQSGNTVSFVNATFQAYGYRESNAAFFGSVTDNAQWDKVSRSIELRSLSEGVQTKLTNLRPEKSFLDLVHEFIDNNPYDATTPKIEARIAEICNCFLNGFELNPRKPSILCDCISSCTNGIEQVISGGVNNMFAQKTSICAASYYAGFISQEGGYVEALYSGSQTVKNGPDKKIQSFSLYHEQEIFTTTYTLKKVGYAVSATNPPTTKNPKTGGFFGAKTTTANPFVAPDPGRNFSKLNSATADPAILVGLFLVGKDYAKLLQKNLDLDEYEKSFGRVQATAFGILSRSALNRIPSVMWEILFIDNHPERSDGVVAIVAVNGPLSSIVSTVRSMQTMREGGLYRQLEMTIKTPTFASLRYTSKLLNSL